VYNYTRFCVYLFCIYTVFVKKFGAHDLGKELIKMYNSSTANAQELQQIESRPYFLGRLTEAQLEEERKKARKKGEEIGEQKGEYKKAIKAAKNMLADGMTSELISKYLDLDINTIRSLSNKLLIQDMNIDIRRLSPDAVDDYIHYFDTTPHWYDSDKNKCYCIPYCNDDYEDIKSLVTTEEGKRQYAIQSVKNGKLQGYLAYCNDKIVGWCNALHKVI